jgi:hypothetical protein
MAYGIEFEIARTHLPIAGILRHAHQVPDTVALIDHDTQITYGEFLPRIQQTALRLARAGVGRGDRVALVAGNCAEFPIAANAVNYLGAIIVPVNFRLAAGEIAYLLDDSSPQVVIADQEHGALVRSAVAESPLDIPVMDLPSLTAGGDDASVPAPVMCEDTDPQAQGRRAHVLELPEHDDAVVGELGVRAGSGLGPHRLAHVPHRGIQRGDDQHRQCRCVGHHPVEGIQRSPPAGCDGRARRDPHLHGAWAVAGDRR